MKRTPPVFPPDTLLSGRIVLAVPAFLMLLLIAGCDSVQPTKPTPPKASSESAVPDTPTTPVPSVPPTPSSDAPPTAEPAATLPPAHPEAQGSGKPATGQHAEPSPGKSSRLRIPQTLPRQAERRTAPLLG